MSDIVGDGQSILTAAAILGVIAAALKRGASAVADRLRAGAARGPRVTLPIARRPELPVPSGSDAGSTLREPRAVSPAAPVSAASSADTGPVTLYNELELLGRAPELEAFCAQYPELPSLRERLLGVKALRADLRELNKSSPRASIRPMSELGGYRLLQHLGHGGMGNVFVAQRGSDPGYFAVKVVDTTTDVELERFKREANLAARLDHPNLARIVNWGTEGQVAWIASELVHGFTVRELIRTARRHGRRNPTDWLLHALDQLAPGSPAHQAVRRDGPTSAVVDLARQVADALGHAHHRGVVHRDVKPSNIIINFDGVAKLIDFGLSLSIAAVKSARRITQVGFFVGTVDYASPEQLRGERDAIGAWTDVYGLGVTLFEMLTLHSPFSSRHFQDRLDKASEPPAAAVTSLNHLVPMSLSAVIRRALDPLPQKRFQDGAQFAEALARRRRPTWTGVSFAGAASASGVDDTVRDSPLAERPARTPDETIFKAVFAALAEHRRFVRGDGYVVGAVAPHTAIVRCATLVTNAAAPVAALVIGRHGNAQLQLTGDDTVASRHLLAWLTVEGQRRRVRLFDLNTGAGFSVEGFGPCESVVSDGPLIVGLGSYRIVFLPTDEVFWPANPDAAWDALPPTLFLDSRDAGGSRSQPVGAAARAARDEGSGSTRVTVLPRPTEYLAASGPPVTERELAGVITLVGPTKKGRFSLTREQLARGVLLGQDTRCDVPTELFMYPEAVSRVHAMLACEDGRALVFDLASTNGTLLNGSPIVAAALQNTAEIELAAGNLVRWRAKGR